LSLNVKSHFLLGACLLLFCACAELYAREKQEFQRLVAELKRLALKKAYSQEEIASEVGVTTMTINHWLTRYSLTAQRGNI
jgi:hypothetical protein